MTTTIPSNALPPAYDTLNHSPPPSYTATSTPVTSSTASRNPTKTVTISTTKALPSSSQKVETFPYHESLADFDIEAGEWALFTHSLHKAIAPTTAQKSLAVLSGVGTACVISEPFTSRMVGRYVLRRQVLGSVKRGLETHVPDQEGKETPAMVLDRWNHRWSSHGVQVSLEVWEHGVPEGHDPAKAAEKKKMRLISKKKYLRVVVKKIEGTRTEALSNEDYTLTARDLEKNLAVLDLGPVYNIDSNES